MFADDLLSQGNPPRVLIAGGGIAALELLLALRVLAGTHLAKITLLTPNAELAPRAMTVAEPFGRGAAQTHDWSQIAQDQRARLTLDTLVAVDTAARIAYTHGGRRIPYDVLAVAVGARRVEPFAGALTFGMSADSGPRLRALVAEMPQGAAASLAFALPSPSVWPLPLYELALLTAQALRERACPAAVKIVTPEARPLEIFGTAAGQALAPALDVLGIELLTDAQPRDVLAGGLRLRSGEIVAAGNVVTLADIVARPIPGVPVDRAGFIPVDLHGRVEGADGLYAAGEATSFPLRQGGLATQQADAAAAAIAATCGAGNDHAPFTPVLRGRLLTSGAPLYLHNRPSGPSIASARALWSPPEKVAGRYLAPYLASARPTRVGASPLTERVPARPAASQEHDAAALAIMLAEAEARCGNHSRATQALEAARALQPDGRDAGYERVRALVHATGAAR